MAVESTMSSQIIEKHCAKCVFFFFAGALQLLSWGAIVVHPGVSSSIVALTFMLMLSNVGGAISEVMNDALVAEAGKRKKGAKQGE